MNPPIRLDALRRVMRGLWWRPAFWRSMRVLAMVYVVALCFSTHRQAMDLRVNDTQSLGDVNLDKPVHALAFALVMALAVMARLAGRGALWPTQVTLAAVLVTILATANELTQQFVGRTTSSADLLANLLGVGVMALLLLWLPGRDARGTRARVTLSARLVLLTMLPVLTVVTCVPALAMEVQWPTWWRAIFTTDAGPRQLATLALGGGMVVVLWQALGGLRRHRLTAMGLATLAAAAVWSATTYNPAVHAMDALLGLLGAAAACIALGAIPAPQALLTAASTSPAPASPQGSTDTSQGATSDAPGQPAEGGPAVQAANQDRFVGHARTVSLLTLLSRVTGLVRESVLAATLGLSPVAAAFVFAFQIPNLFRRLFGEGALSAAIVPVYARQLKEDPAVAARFVSLCLALLAVVLGALTLLGEAALAALLAWGDWGQDTALAIRLTMIMLPYMPLVCGVALAGAVLQVRGRFASTAAAPVLLNLVVVAVALAATWRAQTPQALASAVTWVGWSVVLAGVLQLAWQLVALRREMTLTRRFEGTRPAMGRLMAMFLPMVLGLAAFQINTFLDAVMAMGFSAKAGQAGFEIIGHHVRYPLQEASVAALGWAQRLYEFPLGIFGIAIATAIFPALSHAAADKLGGATRFGDILRNGLRLSVFIGLPASVGLIIVALPLSRLAFERGQFGLEDSRRVAWLLCGYAPAIWAYTMNHVLTRAFYARGDARTPLRVSLMMVGMNLLLNLTLVWPLGAQGFAWATAGGAILQAAILLWTLQQRGERPMDRAVAIGWGKAALASAVMAGALVPLVRVAQVDTLSRTASAAWLAGLVVAGGGVYLAMATALRCTEIGWLLRRRAA